MTKPIIIHTLEIIGPGGGGSSKSISVSEAGRKGGQSRSPAKLAAVRENMRKINERKRLKNTIRVEPSDRLGGVSIARGSIGGGGNTGSGIVIKVIDLS